MRPWKGICPVSLPPKRPQLVLLTGSADVPGHCRNDAMNVELTLGRCCPTPCCCAAAMCGSWSGARRGAALSRVLLGLPDAEQ